ncbi:helix-turn-helix domain-containing GNAT family N-acetyltransferase [Photobacterium jeanii]|uniref:bifunctional helix-turn-helix transcriptional regulator/GNAT family N-acetyltransferase n=1 Tax=Photobacterium jeanii TaxID=858640 RepID=UPI000830BDCF|nr:helix-turn-helix domain-containing GNAT family N-acetyltransferase [Photobacterium jeanii]PST87725.1 MarR family transcriptional regulator [Photobacterium jeanii]
MDANQLRQLSRQLVRQLGMLDNHCGQLAITPVQAHALIELWQAPCTVNQMAAKLRVDKSNASRALAVLFNKGMVESRVNPDDKRSQLSALTAHGKETLDALNSQLNHDVSQFLAQMDEDEINQLERSLSRYSKSIHAAEKQHGYTLRSLTALDNTAIATIIRKVSAEYGLTADKGYGVADPTLDDMSQVYAAADSAYWVIEKDQRILGGGGVAPLAGEEKVCELQKMYFLPQLRGKGLARALAVKALKFAREQGYRACYLETTAELGEAIALYESLGFVRINQALGNTGHDACEVRMLKTF